MECRSFSFALLFRASAGWLSLLTIRGPGYRALGAQMPSGRASLLDSELLLSSYLGCTG